MVGGDDLGRRAAACGEDECGSSRTCQCQQALGDAARAAGSSMIRPLASKAVDGSRAAGRHWSKLIHSATISSAGA